MKNTLIIGLFSNYPADTYKYDALNVYRSHAGYVCLKYNIAQRVMNMNKERL